MLQHYINHVSLVIDRSGSMTGKPVVQVFDRELNYLKQRSIELDQETRISIYLFDSVVECLTFDMDVMRFKTLAGHWSVRGSTALIDGVLKSVEDNLKLPEMYGDHAFLQYVITDGQENQSRNTPQKLKETLGSLPDNWTTACLVPDKTGVDYAQRFGFNGGSISIWDTKSAGGFAEVGQQFSKTIDSYMAMRASGVRGTTGLFTLDSSGLTKTALQEVKGVQVYGVKREGYIREYVETEIGKTYSLGMAFYQPTSSVVIQDSKEIYVQDVKTGKVYTGNNIRQLLGLPASTAKVSPGNHKDWRIFVQSTSVNRKLLRNTNILVKG